MFRFIQYDCPLLVDIEQVFANTDSIEQYREELLQ